MSNKSNSLLAFISGLAAGALAGILLAPASGKETRDKIIDEVDELSEKAKKNANEHYEKASKKLEELKDSSLKYVEQRLKEAEKKVKS
jgi:gas vesicle protein